VVLHEFAHGLVAWWGGDYTIRERGGLTLNPIQYIDPLNSLILPLVFLLIGGIPLPGGVTYIRKDLLRGRGWDAASSLAGPAMNFLLFLACMLPMHPKIGWVELSLSNPSGPATVLATLGMLQFIGMVFNLLPVPPLDGFQALAAYMDEDSRMRLLQPHVQNMAMLGLFVSIWVFGLITYILGFGLNLLTSMGFGPAEHDFVLTAFVLLLSGRQI
jgi:Zn-dependent protease